MCGLAISSDGACPVVCDICDSIRNIRAVPGFLIRYGNMDIKNLKQYDQMSIECLYLFG